MNSKSKIAVLTGGGTAGHVIPHLALKPYFEKNSYHLIYIGTNKIEKHLATSANIPFHTIYAGKLRRYLSWENIRDFFLVGVGFLQSFFLLLKLRPSLVFSKGGYVSVPVCLAAYCLRIPVYSHESDLTPGLANRIIQKVAKKVFYAFFETKKYLPGKNCIHVGIPIREELTSGNLENGLKFAGFSSEDSRPIILVMGGSLGAERINQTIFAHLDELLKKYRIIHITGKGHKIEDNAHGYTSFEFVGNELKDLFKIADVVLSRSGANTIFELLYLKKPMILIPLERGSRGDQVQNAEVFTQRKWALTLREKDLNLSSLEDKITTALTRKGLQLDTQDIKQLTVQHENIIKLISA